MDKKTINTKGMMENVDKYVKKVIAMPIYYVDKINVNSILSVKQRLRKQ